MFTKEDLLQYCVDRVFENTCIYRGILPYSELRPLDTVVSIKGDKVIGLFSHQIQRNDGGIHIDFSTKSITKSILGLDLNCNVVISTGDKLCNKKYTRLCFTTEPISNNIQIPDPQVFYRMESIKTDLENDTPFDSKIDKINFVGSDTDSRYDENGFTQRIRFCIKAKNNDRVFARIADIRSSFSQTLKDISTKKLPICEQIRYKYILDIDGESVSWDKIPWAFLSNSYLIHLKSEHHYHTWYYSFIMEYGIMPDLTEEEVLGFKVNYDADIKAKQKLLASFLLDPDTHHEYLRRVLIRYNKIYNS